MRKNTLSYQPMPIPTFPVLKNSTYLNTAYVGPLSQELFDFRRAEEEKYLALGNEYKVDTYNTLDETHRVLALFFGLPSHHCFVVPNFSSGIRYIMPLLPKTSKVLYVNEDYPSLLNSFQSQGLNTKGIPLTETIEQDLEKELSKTQYDVLILSIVHYTSGILIDTEYLNQLKENYPNLLIIADGTQFLGAHSFQFNQSPFDVVVASGYKWLLAGFGNGVLMVSEAFLLNVNIQSSDLKEIIFQGHFNLLATSSLKFAVEQLVTLNFEELLNKKKKLSGYAKEALLESNYLDQRVNKRKEHSSIFLLNGSTSLYQHLMKSNISCVQRSTGVRVSFHYYNTIEEVDILCKALKAF